MISRRAFVALASGLLVPAPAFALRGGLPKPNLIRNSEMIGAAAGSPGTLPRDWTNYYPDGGFGITVQIAAVGAIESALTAIDMRVSGTGTVGLSGNSYVAFGQNTAIPAVQGDVVTASIYSKLLAGAGLSYQLLAINELDASGNFLTNQTTSINIGTGDLGAQRTRLTMTVANAATRFVLPNVVFGYNVSVAYDGTFRLGGMKLERGAQVTEFLRRAA